MVMSEKESSFGFSSANSSQEAGFNVSLLMSTNQDRVAFAESLIRRKQIKSPVSSMLSVISSTFIFINKKNAHTL
jgi:hypothetical protein